MSMAEGKASVRTVDMSNVKDGGGSFNKRRVVAGDYEGKIVKVEDAKVKKGDNEGEFQYLFTIVLTNHPANKYPYYCTLVPNQLWKLRNLFIAAGKQVPKKKLKLDPNVIIGKTIGVTMEDDEYEGKSQSVVAAVFPASELNAIESDDDDDDVTDDDEAETEDDEDTSTDTEDEAEDEEEEEDDEAAGDEYDAMDRAALKKAIKKIDDSFRITKSMSDDDLRQALRNADGDDEEEEDEEPEPAPAKKAKKKKDEVTDDDLEELDIDDV